MCCDFQRWIPGHAAIIPASFVDDAAGGKQIAVPHAGVLQQDAVRPQMVAGTYSGAAKHNGVGSQEIEIAYAGVMREIDRAVEIVAVANAGIAIDRAAALDDIALANDGRGSNGRPGMDEIHEGRATRLEGRKDLFAQLRFAHAEDKKVIRSGRVVVGLSLIHI